MSTKEKELANTLESMGWVILSRYVSEKERNEFRTPEGIFRRFLLGLLDQGDVRQLDLIKEYLEQRGLFNYEGLRELVNKGSDKVMEVLERSGYIAQFKYLKGQSVKKELIVKGIFDLVKLAERYEGNLHKFYLELRKKAGNDPQKLLVELEKLYNDVKPASDGGFKLRFFGPKKFSVLIRDLIFAKAWEDSDYELLKRLEIPIDVHIREFFKKVRWGKKDDEIKKKAKELFEYPVIADVAIWELHRTLCKDCLSGRKDCFVKLCVNYKKKVTSLERRTINRSIYD